MRLQTWIRLAAAGAIVLAVSGAGADGQAPTTPGQRFQEAVTLMESRGDYAAAIRIFDEISGGADRTLAARALVYQGVCYERMGREEARKAYRRVIEQFADQRAAVAEARSRLATLERARAVPARRTVRLERAWERVPPDLPGVGGVSADARWMSVVARNGDLVTLDLGSAQRRSTIPVTRLSVAGEHGRPWPSPAPSPDGRSLAFTWQGADGSVELRVAYTDGSRTRALRRAAVGEWLAASRWTARGHLLVQAVPANGPTRLSLIDPGTGATVREIAGPSDLRSPTLSPDERWLAWSGPAAGDGSHTDVFIAPVAGGAPLAVASSEANDLMPVWTHDGRSVLFVSDRTGTPGLWLQALTAGRLSGEPRLLQQDIGRIVQPIALTPGGAFYYFRQTGLVDVFTVALETDGKAVGAPVSAPQRFVGSNMMPTWSPDGTRLAYLTQMAFAPQESVAVRGMGPDTARTVRTRMGLLRAPQWSPQDGRLLVKGRDAQGRYGLHALDLSTGETSAILTVPARDESTLGEARWSATGDSVIYVRPEGGVSALVSRRLDDGSEQVLLTAADDWWFAGSPSFSVRRDGAIAFIQARDQSQAVVVRTPDGALREVWKTAPPEYFMSVGWQPPGTHVIVARVSGPQVTGQPLNVRLWRVEVGTGAVSPVGVEMTGLRDLSVAPDGRNVAFTAGWPTREVWVIEHFLPPAPTATAATRPRSSRFSTFLPASPPSRPGLVATIRAVPRLPPQQRFR